jgi:hypothetical protein
MCVHEDGKSLIQAHSLATGQRETILEALPTAEHSAQEIAELIVQAVNAHATRERLIEEMTAALEICLECETLDWAAEHDAEIVLRRAKGRA